MTIRFRWACPLAMGLMLALGATPSDAADLPALGASWIWLDRDTPADQSYNLTILARKDFELPRAPRRAVLRITADSYYRVTINGRWVNDGPGRAWPDHHEYDEIDVSTELQAGSNRIEIVARYFGVGDFHRVPQRPGLLAQLDAAGADGRMETIVATDGSWQTADAEGWTRNTPKASIQMEAFELYDARLGAEAKPPEWAPARVVAATFDGPWQGLRPRDVALLTRQPVAFRTFLGAKHVTATGRNFCLPAARLVHPGLIEANHHTSMACGMATVLVADRELSLDAEADGLSVAIDGQRVSNRRAVVLTPGRHLVLAFVTGIYGHEKEKALRFRQTEGYTLSNPIEAGHENPWCFLRFPEYAVVGSDQTWQVFMADDPRLRAARDGYEQARDRALGSVTSADQLRAVLGGRAELIASDRMFVIDPFWQFTHRAVVDGPGPEVESPGALLAESPSTTVVHPSPAGDIELLYDLGEQNVGYYDLELMADAGVTVDLFGVEYIAPDGRVQFSWGNRNGMRYITREGVNRFTSLKRRSQRYLFVTLRDLKAPVAIRKIQLVASTYPVELVGSFQSSDERLNRIHEISTRTLRLCMEDTFTDCPLYEQTHWVGDARNESLFAYGTFGAHDLALRCIRLTAESVGRLPIAGSQTPSCWDVLIPNWSFLWGISVWDYGFETGDAEAVRPYWPAVIANLEGAERMLDDRDLLSTTSWNFFDWTPIDADHRVVLHNSLFCVGAIDAALRLGAALGDHSKDAWLQAFRARLAGGINRTWDDAKGAYPDSIHADGTVSPSTSQHTSFLAILFDVIPPDRLEAARRNLLDPPPGMVRVGSPFAALYQYHALEAIGREDAIMKSIYDNYLPMLEAGATTVWESYASGTTGGGGFPTRSHCHAWSSAPNYYLPRIVLGVKATAPGGSALTISPRPSGLTWARGTVATAKGPVSVSWMLEDETLSITCRVPDGVELGFATNPELAGRRVVLNGQPVP